MFLKIISNWKDATTTDASILLKALDSEFLISLQVIKVNTFFFNFLLLFFYFKRDFSKWMFSVLFSYGLPLCAILQSKDIDLKEAILVNLANKNVTTLKKIKININIELNKMFKNDQVIKN